MLEMYLKNLIEKKNKKKNNHFSREPMQSSRKTFLATSPVGLVTDQAH